MSVVARCLSGPFTLPEDPAAVRRAERVLDTVRIVFGLLYAHRSLDMAGFALLSGDPAAFAARTVWGAALGLGIAAGLLTPLCLVALLHQLTFAPVSDYLGLQVVRMVAWGLLLAGAGRTRGLDAWGLARPRLRPIRRALYVLAPAEPGALGLVRLLLLALYWAVTFSGVRFHLFDPFWLRGEVLQLATTMPYFSDHSARVADFARASPRLFDFLCSAGLYVQALWQLALLPLCYVPVRGVRAFVVFQGLAFFLVSTFLLNLGYLGPFELCLWGLVFGVAPRWGLDPAVRGASASREGPARGLVFLAGFLAAGLFLATNLLGIADDAFGTLSSRHLRKRTQLYASIFGLTPVNVFNESDMLMGTAHLVLVETDRAGHPRRLVPFLDRDGGRLDYLRNDFLYFGHSLPWQRLRRDQQFSEGQPGGGVELTDATLKLLRTVVQLDACLTGFSPPRYYVAVLLSRTVSREGRFPVWSEGRVVTTVALRVGRRRTTEARARLVGLAGTLGCYDLPPGHAGSAGRGERTLAWAHDLGADEALPAASDADKFSPLPDPR